MLKIDEACITRCERDELGSWEVEACYRPLDVDVSGTWHAMTDEEKADERRFAVQFGLDGLRIDVIELMFETGLGLEVEDDDLLDALEGAQRMGTDDVTPILTEAWSRELLDLRRKPVGPDEAFLALAKAM